MNSYLSSSFLCVFITILFSCSLTSASASLVPTLCKDIAKADPIDVSYDFCVSQLESNPQSSHAMAPELGGISFELSISRANDVSSIINKFKKIATLDPPARNVLLDCSKLYAEEILVDLEAGLKAMKHGDYNTANDKVTSAMNAAATCEEGFKDFWTAPSCLNRVNDEFYRLAAISLAFTNLLRIVN